MRLSICATSQRLALQENYFKAHTCQFIFIDPILSANREREGERGKEGGERESRVNLILIYQLGRKFG